MRLSPHHKPSRFALGRRSQAHATKKTTRIKRKTKPKARRRGFFIENFHIYGIAVNAVHNDAREIKIFDKGRFSALVGYSGVAEIGNKYAYSARSVRHYQVGEGAVSDSSVAQPAYSYTAGVTCKRAVGDCHAVADFIFGKRVVVGANYYAVVSANYVAVGHENVFEEFICMSSLLGYCTSALIFNRSKKTSSPSLTQ